MKCHCEEHSDCETKSKQTRRFLASLGTGSAISPFDRLRMHGELVELATPFKLAMKI
ncbi:MAG: hypothetical protein AB1606_08110 [Nitrospirota bacterium]